jgi:hypothetical protein
VFKDSLKSISGSVFSNLSADNVDEFFKIENFVALSHCPYNFEYVRISLVKSDFFEYFDDFLWINGSASIIIEYEEDISQLLVVFWTDSVSPSCRDFFLGL